MALGADFCNAARLYVRTWLHPVPELPQRQMPRGRHHPEPWTQPVPRRDRQGRTRVPLPYQYAGGALRVALAGWPRPPPGTDRPTWRQAPVRNPHGDLRRALPAPRSRSTVKRKVETPPFARDWARAFCGAFAKRASGFRPPPAITGNTAPSSRSAVRSSQAYRKREKRSPRGRQPSAGKGAPRT